MFQRKGGAFFNVQVVDLDGIDRQRSQRVGSLFEVVGGFSGLVGLKRLSILRGGTREGEAPAEPLLSVIGSAGASPSRHGIS